MNIMTSMKHEDSIFEEKTLFYKHSVFFCCRKLREFVPLVFLFLCTASFMSDAVNILVFFNKGDIIFGSLTLFCLVVPGYFGISHLLKNKEFLEDYDYTLKTSLRRIFLYVFCIVLFPLFNIVFKAAKLFLHPRD